MPTDMTTETEPQAEAIAQPTPRMIKQAYQTASDTRDSVNRALEEFAEAKGLSRVCEFGPGMRDKLAIGLAGIIARECQAHALEQSAEIVRLREQVAERDIWLRERQNEKAQKRIAALEAELAEARGGERELCRILEAIAKLVSGDPPAVQPEQLYAAIAITLKNKDALTRERDELRQCIATDFMSGVAMQLEKERDDLSARLEGVHGLLLQISGSTIGKKKQVDEALTLAALKPEGAAKS